MLCIWIMAIDKLQFIASTTLHKCSINAAMGIVMRMLYDHRADKNIVGSSEFSSFTRPIPLGKTASNFALISGRDAFCFTFLLFPFYRLFLCSLPFSSSFSWFSLVPGNFSKVIAFFLSSSCLFLCNFFTLLFGVFYFWGFPCVSQDFPALLRTKMGIYLIPPHFLARKLPKPVFHWWRTFMDGIYNYGWPIHARHLKMIIDDNCEGQLRRRITKEE